jgi:hypothetical protein
LRTQRSHRTRKSAVAAAVLSAVAAGGDGLEPVLFRTTSAQEGDMHTVPELYCGASCRHCDGDPDPAGQAAPTSLPVSGGAEPRGARLGGAGSPAVPSSTASILSPQIGGGGEVAGGAARSSW